MDLLKYYTQNNKQYIDVCTSFNAVSCIVEIRIYYTKRPTVTEAKMDV
jgi:hypothetical protein